MGQLQLMTVYPSIIVIVIDLYVVSGRMPQRGGKLTVLNLLTRQKLTFLPRRGDSLHRFTWSLARARCTWVRLATRKSHQSVHGGGNAAPKISKISTFW